MIITRGIFHAESFCYELTLRAGLIFSLFVMRITVIVICRPLVGIIGILRSSANFFCSEEGMAYPKSC